LNVQSPTAAGELRRLGLGDRMTNAFGLVLLLVFGTFVLLSLVPYRGWAAVVITAFASITATVALATARALPRVVVLAGRLSVLAVALSIVGAAAGGRAWLGVAALLEVFLLAGGALAVLRAVITENRVGFRTILGAVSVYVTLGVLFSFVYVAVARIQGGDFFAGGVQPKTGEVLFFSMTTLTTTGYGNFVPAGQPGEMLAVLEMLVGQIFLVTLIARLVSMWEPGHLLREGGGLVSRGKQDGA
jgi:Ion channel